MFIKLNISRVAKKNIFTIAAFNNINKPFVEGYTLISAISGMFPNGNGGGQWVNSLSFRRIILSLFSCSNFLTIEVACSLKNTRICHA